jgi:hypothetical protein
MATDHDFFIILFFQHTVQEARLCITARGLSIADFDQSQGDIFLDNCLT